MASPSHRRKDTGTSRYSGRRVAEQKREPTEKTPKGYEVRIPERRDFFSNLKKIAGKNAPKRRLQKGA
jgi:hypothetical protein